MKLNHKIDIDILEFILTGKFDCLELGNTKDWISNNFPDPDDYATGTCFKDTSIWRYGNIELHFDQQVGHQKLVMIFSDYIGELSAGSNINLHPWIFNQPETLYMPMIVNELHQLKVDYAVTYNVGCSLCSI